MKTKHKDRDIFHTNYNCTQINKFIYSRDGLQFDLDLDTCKNLGETYSVDHIKKYSLINRCEELSGPEYLELLIETKGSSRALKNS